MRTEYFIEPVIAEQMTYLLRMSEGSELHLSIKKDVIRLAGYNSGTGRHSLIAGTRHMEDLNVAMTRQSMARLIAVADEGGIEFSLEDGRLTAYGAGRGPGRGSVMVSVGESDMTFWDHPAHGSPFKAKGLTWVSSLVEYKAGMKSPTIFCNGTILTHTGGMFASDNANEGMIEYGPISLHPECLARAAQIGQDGKVAISFGDTMTALVIEGHDEESGVTYSLCWEYANGRPESVPPIHKIIDQPSRFEIKMDNRELRKAIEATVLCHGGDDTPSAALIFRHGEIELRAAGQFGRYQEIKPDLSGEFSEEEVSGRFFTTAMLAFLRGAGPGEVTVGVKQTLSGGVALVLRQGHRMVFLAAALPPGEDCLKEGWAVDGL